MKYLISFVCLVLILACNNTTRIPKKRIDYQIGFDPGIKSIKEYECQQYWTDKIPPQIVKSSCRLSKLTEYTIEGFFAKELTWYSGDSPNNPGSIKIIKHNDAGQIIEEFYKSTGIFNTESKTVYSYNTSGFQTERILFDKGKIIFREETAYDEFNCPIKKTFYGKDNNIEQSATYEYDDKNREILDSYFDNSNNLKYKVKYFYNGDQDEYVESKTYDSNGKLTSEYKKSDLYKTNKINGIYTDSLPGNGYKDIEYYASGKVKKWHFKNQNGEDVYQTYDDVQQLITERKIYYNGKWQDTYTWKYREDGSTLEKTESTARILGIPYFKKTEYYKYDIKGYWIEKVVVDTEGRAIELKAREIEYYAN